MNEPISIEQQITAIRVFSIWLARKCDKLAAGRCVPEYERQAKKCLTVILGRKPTADEVKQLTEW